QCLLVFLLLSIDGSTKASDGEGNPVGRPFDDPFTLKVVMFNYNERRPTPYETVHKERARIGCLMVFCHFENKNECRAEC
ncbi:hypothetical protein PMAYCL1PPCAC_03867, partial [Pristionchus mayeri]